VPAAGSESLMAEHFRRRGPETRLEVLDQILQGFLTPVDQKDRRSFGNASRSGRQRIPAAFRNGPSQALNAVAGRILVADPYQIARQQVMMRNEEYLPGCALDAADEKSRPGLLGSVDGFCGRCGRK